MRLIEADELKKAIRETEYFNEYAFSFICDIIDNAPTADLDDIYNDVFERGYEKGYLAGLHDAMQDYLKGSDNV